MKFLIYKATNLLNDKIYIGQTSRKLKERISGHKHSAFTENSSLKFHKAIRKYGLDSFKWEIIDNAETQDEIHKKEIYWISYYDSFNNGYNMTIGGEGTKGCSEGINNPRCQSVVKLDLEGNLIDKYPYISSALESINQHDISHIVKCCKGKINMAYGYRWMYEDDYMKLLNNEIKLKKLKQTKVIQTDLEGNFLNEYSSLKEGADTIDGNRIGIGKCCRGIQESYKGFKWYYSDKYNQ